MAEILIEIAAATERERILIAARRGEDHAMEPEAQLRALLDAMAALERTGISYALIGGIAVGVHSGIPRATVDVDFAVKSGENYTAIESALCSAGFELIGRHPHSLNFRDARGEPVQIAFDPQFDAMIERAEYVTVGQVRIAVVRKEDLIAMKERAAADPTRRRSKALRDLADVALLRGDVPDPDEGW